MDEDEQSRPSAASLLLWRIAAVSSLPIAQDRGGDALEGGLWRTQAALKQHRHRGKKTAMPSSSLK